MGRPVLRRIVRGVLRVCARIAAGLGILGCLLLLWIWYLNRPPHYPVTLPPPPTPNALDDFQRAYRTIRYPSELRGLRTDWDKLEIRMRSVAERRMQYNGSALTRQSDIGFSLTVPELLAENQEALTFIREGLQHPYALPITEGTQDEYYVRQRIAAEAIDYCGRLLEANALYQLKTGHTRAAADALVDPLELGAVTGGWGTCIGLPRRGVDRLRDIAADLPAEDARAIVARLERMASKRPGSYAEYLEQCRPLVLLGFTSDLTDGTRWQWYTSRNEVARPMMHPSPLEDRPPRTNLFYAWTVPNAQVPRIADRYLMACIRVARRPVSAHASYPVPPPDVINWSAFAWDDHKIDHLGWALGRFKADSLMLSVALHGYRKEHRQYPAQLQELMKDGWLTRVPLDPFTQKGPIRYRSDGKSFVLYSYGPDGDDDGGIPIGNPITVRDPDQVSLESVRGVVGVDSKGDVVFGVNERSVINPNYCRI